MRHRGKDDPATQAARSDLHMAKLARDLESAREWSPDRRQRLAAMLRSTSRELLNND